MKTMRNREIHSAGRSWSLWSESKSELSDEDNINNNTDTGNSVETRSLPPSSPKRWHPTTPKPFKFALRDEAEKYMTLAETEAEERLNKGRRKSGSKKKRRVRAIPLTSRIPLYDKLMAAKEERSRIVREESAWCLMSQVKPFRLECDRRAGKVLSRSSPELRGSNSTSNTRFKAKPVPKNLFGTEIYDRMLEDEYFRQLQKRLRAAELMKSSSLPPSMARRERIKSATSAIPRTRHCLNDTDNLTPTTSERSRSVMTDLSTRGSNLAAVLRCQATREKCEREIRERMENKAREYAMKMRTSLTGRKPAWKALRTAARSEHSRELDFRVSLRRDEAREQAERHRLEMELMLDRVTQIPTLFERHSQGYQMMRHLQSRAFKLDHKKKKRNKKKVDNNNSSSLESDDCHGSRIDSFIKNKSLKQSTPTAAIIDNNKKRKLRVSINEKAELIKDDDEDDVDDDDDEDDRYTCCPSDEIQSPINQDDFQFQNK